MYAVEQQCYQLTSAGAGYVVVQNVTSSHTANFTQQWCKTHMPGFWDKDMWPTSSPDLSPMNFTT